MYEKKINHLSPDHRFKIIIGYERCMARLPDFKTQKSKEISNINKRCKRKSNCLELCKYHSRKLYFGKVDEYPNENMIYYYKKNDNDIESKIDLDHREFYNYVNLKKKKVNLIIRMSFDNLEYTSVKKFSGENSENNMESMYKSVIENNNIDKKFVTIDEKKKIMENIKKYSKKSDDIYEHIKNINLRDLSCINVSDYDFNTSVLYKVHFYNKNYLINDRKKIIGSFQDWIDEDDIVPLEYKTADNKVLHPCSNLPILEIELNRASGLLCGLNPGVYREYSYNESLEAFMKTNKILI